METLSFAEDSFPSVLVLIFQSRRARAVLSLDLPKLESVRLPRSAFANTKTLEISDVNPNVQFLDEHGALWENDWPMESLVINALKGSYPHHLGVLNTAGDPKRYFTVNLPNIENLWLVSSNKHAPQ